MKPARVAARAEDLQWMADTGETPTGAAARLGLTVDGLEKWCKNHGLHQVLDRLRTNHQHWLGGAA